VQSWCSPGAVLVQSWCSPGAVLVQDGAVDEAVQPRDLPGLPGGPGGLLGVRQLPDGAQQLTQPIHGLQLAAAVPGQLGQQQPEGPRRHAAAAAGVQLR
jgi:hypothetical protein